MKRVLFLLLITTILFGCDDDEKQTGYKFTVSDIVDLDGTIDHVAVNISYAVKDRITGFIRYENKLIGSAPIKNKGFAVYLPEYLPDIYVHDGPHFAFHEYNELTVSNPNVKITRSISFIGYSNGISKGVFICDNVHSNPLVEKGYNVIQLAYSNVASTITGTKNIFDVGQNELRLSYDLDMKVGYNLFMESTLERTFNERLHHISFTAPINQGDGGTRWRFLNTTK